MPQLPIVDFARFNQGTAQDRQQVAQQLYHACHQFGFMYVKNVGISQTLLHRFLAAAQQFFALPDAVKQQMPRSDETNCGYIGLQRERLNPSQPGDLKEALNVGLEMVWPPGQDAIRAAVLEFYQQCTTAVAPMLLRAFAIALDLPESFFVARHRQYYFLRLLHYPPLSQAPAPGQLRAGEHTDYGSITLLLQSQGDGLEVRTRQGDWIAAPPVPDTLVVNVGDLMQRWTNDRLLSTPHRVAVPSGAAAGQSRYSIALFCDPNPEVEVVCLESCCSSDDPPRYSPIRAGDYLASRLAATY